MLQLIAQQVTMVKQQVHKLPLTTGLLWLLIAHVMLSGPATCVVHCWLLELEHAYTAHQHHHDGTGITTGPHAICDFALQNEHHPENSPPSALTIAILLPSMLTVTLHVVAYIAVARAVVATSLAIPPPRRPPRFANSFI